MRLREALREARKRGRDAGRGAASWVFDGNTNDETYRVFLQQNADGDPALHNWVHEPAWLSGEWAGESISELLGDLIEAVPVRSHDQESEVAQSIEDEYEMAASTAFWHELERVALFQTKGR